jgi:hypothetical protein
VVSPCSDRISRVPPYSRLTQFEIRTGLSPAKARLSNRFRLELRKHWPGPRSLATTNGVSLMSFPLGTKMFQFPRLAFVPYVFGKQIPSFDICKSEPWHNAATRVAKIARIQNYRYRRRVAPFGNSRINACSRLPVTYRSVPRPSSPLSAKASTGYP